MLISESTRLTAESLIRYAHLPTHRFNLMDQQTDEFIGRIAQRAGCPYKEKQLAEHLVNSIHHLTRQLNLDSAERREIIKTAQCIKHTAHKKDADMLNLSFIAESLLQRDK